MCVCVCVCESMYDVQCTCVFVCIFFFVRILCIIYVVHTLNIHGCVYKGVYIYSVNFTLLYISLYHSIYSITRYYIYFITQFKI